MRLVGVSADTTGGARLPNDPARLAAVAMGAIPRTPTPHRAPSRRPLMCYH